jgi:NADPH2:quinone reductase
MKAAVYYKNGGPEVFEITDVDRPTCPPDAVLVRTSYISVEGGDLINRELTPPPTVPHIVGYQCSGEIVEVGTGVTGFAIGQLVVSIGASGSHAEYVAMPASQTWLIPAELPLDLAAAVPVAFGTAHECLFGFGRLTAGETVLIHAGAGALGLAAIQLARRAGAKVITTASDDAKLERLRGFGADVTINYATTDFVEASLAATGRAGVDLVIDSIAGANLSRSIATLKYRGRAIIVGVSGRDPERLDPLALWQNCASLQGVYFPSSLPNEHDRAYGMVADLLKDVASGELQVVLDRTFSLEQAEAAHCFVAERKAFGRVLLKP